MPSIESAQNILRLIGMPSKQYAELPALTLLAMANLTELSEWKKVQTIGFGFMILLNL